MIDTLANIFLAIPLGAELKPTTYALVPVLAIALGIVITAWRRGSAS